MSLESTRIRVLSRGDIPGSNGGLYNPGAVLRGSSILMLCRREIDYRHSPTVFAEMVIVDPETLKVVKRQTLKRERYRADARIEDFRCIEFDGMLLAVHSLVNPSHSHTTQMISRIVGDGIQPYDDFDLDFPVQQVEKNWGLFEKDGSLHCLYQLDPLTVFVRSPAGTWRVSTREETGWARGCEEMLSNSTNLIPFMGGYLGFWHTRVNECYVQGAFLLGSDLAPKYRTGILLDGADVIEGYRPGVLYVSSLVEHGGRVLAFYGEGDAHTGVAIFDRDALQRELLQSPFEAVDAVRIRLRFSSMGDLFHGLSTLQKFSAERGCPPINLYISDLGFRRVISVFGIPNLAVYSERDECSYDYTLWHKTLERAGVE